MGNDVKVLNLSFLFNPTEHVQLQQTKDYRAHRHSQSGVETAADTASPHHDTRELVTWNERGWHGSSFSANVLSVTLRDRSV